MSATPSQRGPDAPPQRPPPRAAARRPKRRVRRFLIRTLRVLALLLLLLIGLLFFLLYTSVGTALGVRIALPLVNAGLKGSIEVREVDGSLADSLTLRGVVILDPEGHSAVEIDRLDVTIALTALGDQHVDLRSVRLAGVRYTLFDTTDEVGVARAFESNVPSPPSEEPSPWRVSLPDVEITDASVIERQGGAVWARDVSTELKLLIGPDGLAWHDITRSTVVDLPTGGLQLGEVQVQTRGALRPDGLELEQLDVDAGPHHVALTAWARDGRFELTLIEASTDLEALLPVTKTRLVGPASVRGLLYGEGEQVSAELTATTAGGTVTITAAAREDPAGGQEYRLALDAPDCTPGLVAPMLEHPGAADVVLRLQGVGKPLEDGFVLLELGLSDPRRAGLPVRMAALSARLDAGALDATLSAGTAGGGVVSIRGGMPHVLRKRAFASARLREVSLAPWGDAFAALSGLGATIDRLDVTALATLQSEGPPHVDARIEGLVSGLVLPESLGGPARVSSADLGGELRWPGAGLPLGDVRLVVSSADSECCGGADSLSVRLALAEEGDDTRLHGRVSARGLRAPGGVAAETVALTAQTVLDAKSYLPLSASVTAEIGGAALADPPLRVQTLETTLKMGPLAETLFLEGPISVRDVSMPGLLRVGSATGQASVTLPLRTPEPGQRVTLLTRGTLAVEGTELEGQGRLQTVEAAWDLALDSQHPHGSATVKARSVSVAGQRLDSAAVSVTLDEQGAGHTTASARRGAMSLETVVDVEAAEGLAGPIKLLIRKLSAGTPALGIVGHRGARVKLSPSDEGLHVKVSGLALSRRGVARPELTADATLQPNGAFTASLVVDDANVRSWVDTVERLLGKSLLGGRAVGGELDLTAEIHGRTSAPRGHVEVNLRGGRFGALRNLGLVGEVALEPRALTADLTARWGSNTRVTIDAAVPLRAGGALALERAGRTAVDLEGLDLADLRQLLGLDEGLSGMVAGTVRAQGPLRSGLAQVDLEIERFTWNGLHPLNIRAAVTATGAQTTANLSAGPPGQPWLEVGGSAAIGLIGTLLDGGGARIGRALAGAEVRGSLTVRKLALERVLSLELPEGVGAAQPSAALAFEGRVRRLGVTGQLDVAKVPLGNDQLGDVSLTLARDGEVTTGALELRIGSLTVAQAAIRAPGPLGELALHPAPRSLLRDARVKLDVWTERLELATLERLAPGITRALGSLIATPWLQAKLALTGTRIGPIGRLEAELRGGEGEALEGGAPLLDRVLVQADLGGVSTRVVVEAHPPGDSALTADVVLAVGSKALTGTEVIDWPGLGLTGSIRSTGLRAETIAALLPDTFGRTSGELRLDTTIGGTVAHPHLVGPVAAHFERLVVRPIGLVTDNVDLSLRFDEGGVVLEPLELTHDEGRLSLRLNARTPEYTAERIRLDGRVDLSTFPILRRREVDATLTGGLDIKGTAARPAISGDLTIDELIVRPRAGGRSLQPIGPPADVVFVGEGSGDVPRGLRVSTDAARAAALKLDLDVRVDIPRRSARLTNDMLDVWAGGYITALTGEAGLELLGHVTVVEGEVRMYGRKFVLDPESRVVFGGGGSLDPALDVRARYSLEGIDLPEPYEATTASSHILLTVTGKASKPKVDFTSDPELSQTDILSLIIVGFAVGAAQDDSSNRAGNLLMAMVAQSASRMIQERLPVDIFEVETGADDLSRAKIRVGQRITRDLVLTYQANLSADEDENTHEARLVYEITRYLNLDTSFGDAGVGALDLVFRWRF